MCGIAGIIGAVTPEDTRRIHAMNAVQRHRGPNAARHATPPGAMLGHVRLSIIDLSDNGLQPMSGADGRLVLVFNGEIYNYRELRTELGDSWRFAGECDSEVLLAAWDRWGEACLDRLNGMFAFCVYDTRERTAYLARDRFGQKPIFFAEEHGRLIFASEIKGLLAAGVPARPDDRSWARYLAHASYDDTEATFFAGIGQLRPGECARWSPETGLARRRWYRVADRIAPREDVAVEDAAEECRALLIDAARLHMRADVPVGVSLSGGLDSSALLACIDLAGELHEGVECVSVDFGGDLTERPWIEAAAAHHGLTSRVEPYTPDDFHAAIAPMMWHLEAPIGGLMNCALDAVMGPLREDGFVVVQDGTGLDEAFGGYRNHHNLYLGELMRAEAPGAAQAVTEYAANWGVGEDQARQAALAETVQGGSAIDGTVPVRPELLDSGFIAAHDGTPEAPGNTGQPLRDALADYLQVRKIPRNTRMKDRLSMAYGLELRLPFLDHRLVEFALSLPAGHLFLGGRSKAIVREALAGAMDDGVRRAAKRSIQAPQGPWLMREPMRGMVDDMLAGPGFAARGMFNVEKVRAAYTDFCAHGAENSFFVWQWINVEQWFRTFIDGDPIARQVRLAAVAADPAPGAPVAAEALN